MTQREVPGAVDILGSADAAATVTVNAAATQRQGGLFYKQLTGDNANAPALVSATTIGVRKGAGPGGKDIVSQTAGSLYLAKTPESYACDDDGNLTQDGRWSYTWDAENRLIAMESIASVPEAAKAKLTFAYSAEGRRIQKKVYQWQNGSYALASETRFIYDGWNLIAEMDATNTVTRSYAWGQDLSGSLQGAGGVGGLLAVTTTGTNSGTYLVNYDANGNVLGLVDGQGNAAAIYEYGPFGEAVRVSGAMGAVNPFRFSTKYTDDETGKIDFGHRWYDPSTGRWLSRDPIEENGGLNLYGMVSNDTINSVDYLGFADIQITVTRLNVTATETTGEFRAYMTSGSCCKEVTGQTIEMSRSGGTTSTGGYNYPLSTGNHPAQLNTTAKHTGTEQFVSAENASNPNGPAIPLPNVDGWDKNDYNRNFNVKGTNVCIHYGHNSNWSDMCIIVGRNGSQQPATGRAAASSPPGSTQTNFTPGSSVKVMIDLLQFYDCVTKTLGRTPSMNITVQNATGN